MRTRCTICGMSILGSDHSDEAWCRDCFEAHIRQGQHRHTLLELDVAPLAWMRQRATAAMAREVSAGHRDRAR